MTPVALNGSNAQLKDVLREGQMPCKIQYRARDTQDDNGADGGCEALSSACIRQGARALQGRWGRTCWQVLTKPLKGPEPDTCMCARTTSWGYVAVEATILEVALATICTPNSQSKWRRFHDGVNFRVMHGGYVVVLAHKPCTDTNEGPAIDTAVHQAPRARSSHTASARSCGAATGNRCR